MKTERCTIMLDGIPFECGYDYEAGEPAQFSAEEGGGTPGYGPTVMLLWAEVGGHNIVDYLDTATIDLLEDRIVAKRDYDES